MSLVMKNPSDLSFDQYVRSLDLKAHDGVEQCLVAESTDLPVVCSDHMDPKIDYSKRLASAVKSLHSDFDDHYESYNDLFHILGDAEAVETVLRENGGRPYMPDFRDFYQGIEGLALTIPMGVEVGRIESGVVCLPWVSDCLGVVVGSVDENGKATISARHLMAGTYDVNTVADTIKAHLQLRQGLGETVVRIGLGLAGNEPSPVNAGDKAPNGGPINYEKDLTEMVKEFGLPNTVVVSPAVDARLAWTHKIKFGGATDTNNPYTHYMFADTNRPYSVNIASFRFRLPPPFPV